MPKPSIRQMELAKEILLNIKRTGKAKKNKGQLVESVGYSKTVAMHKPGEVMEQVGVKEALKSFGFDEESAKAILTEIMTNPKEKGENRIKAAQEVFKVFGTYAPEKSIGLTGTMEDLIKINLGKRNEAIIDYNNKGHNKDD